MALRRGDVSSNISDRPLKGFLPVYHFQMGHLSFCAREKYSSGAPCSLCTNTVASSPPPPWNSDFSTTEAAARLRRQAEKPKACECRPSFTGLRVTFCRCRGTVSRSKFLFSQLMRDMWFSADVSSHGRTTVLEFSHERQGHVMSDASLVTVKSPLHIMVLVASGHLHLTVG